MQARFERQHRHVSIVVNSQLAVRSWQLQDFVDEQAHLVSMKAQGVKTLAPRWLLFHGAALSALWTLQVWVQ